MKYQALKQLKTKNKLMKLCNTLEEAQETIKKEGAIFIGFSYMGGFPIYKKDNIAYSIQGLVEGLNIVCSLNDNEIRQFNFK